MRPRQLHKKQKKNNYKTLFLIDLMFKVEIERIINKFTKPG